MQKELIAPCGMNCAICAYYLALQNKIREKGIRLPYCEGCRIRKKICAPIMKKCALLRKGKIEFCFECKKFPCRHLKKLDDRYCKFYHMSMIENSKFIKRHGFRKFLASERKKWRCKKCGGTICCHNGLCFKCDVQKLKKKRQKYRWEECKSKSEGTN